MGKPRDPDYWKKWRAEHPAYRERERKRLAKRPKCHGDRVGQRMRARVRLGQRNGDNGMLEHHPLLAEAAAIASRHVKRDARSMVADPLWEDVVSVAALALIERIHDVDEAVVRFLKNERAWRFHAMPLLLE